MISFLNSDVRALFHELPLDDQRIVMDLADKVAKENKGLKVLFVDPLEGHASEIAIRIYEKMDRVVGIDFNPSRAD